jgi:hypothetical protein
MKRTLKEAAYTPCHYGTNTLIKEHVRALFMAYNFAKPLNILKGLTPYEHTCKVWTQQPNQFMPNPLHSPWDRTVCQRGKFST